MPDTILACPEDPCARPSGLRWRILHPSVWVLDGRIRVGTLVLRGANLDWVAYYRDKPIVIHRGTLTDCAEALVSESRRGA